MGAITNFQNFLENWVKEYGTNMDMVIYPLARLKSSKENGVFITCENDYTSKNFFVTNNEIMEIPEPWSDYIEFGNWNK